MTAMCCGGNCHNDIDLVSNNLVLGHILGNLQLIIIFIISVPSYHYPCVICIYHIFSTAFIHDIHIYVVPAIHALVISFCIYLLNTSVLMSL